MCADLLRHIITKLMLKESEGPVELSVLVGIHAKVLEEQKVRSKSVKVKAKAEQAKAAEGGCCGL